MAAFSRAQLARYFRDADRAADAATVGSLLEDAIAYLFGSVPRVSVTERNEYSAFDTEEIDIACWNEHRLSGLGAPEFPAVILIERKNWSKPVSSIEVAWFIMKVWGRGQRFGILIASNGITGNARDLTRAQQLVARALSQGTTILVITREELLALRNSADLVHLLKRKFTQLVVRQTSFP